jgi:hypothetical protein
MPWTVHARAAENMVLLSTHPLRPEEAMDIAHRLARAAQHVRAYQDQRRRAAEPRPLEALPSFDVIPPAAVDGDVRSDDAAPTEPTPPPSPATRAAPPLRAQTWNEDLR